MQIKLVMVIQKYHPFIGGAERQLRALSSRLKERGVDVTILTRRYGGLPPFELVDGVRVYRLPSPGNKVLAGISFVLSAIYLLHRIRPQIVHAHEILSPATIALYGKRLYSSRVVVKVLGGGVKGDIYKLKKRLFGKWRIANLRKRVDAFIAISREIDDELAGIGIPQEARFYLPNGVDTDHFSPLAADEKKRLRESHGFSSISPLVIYAGRLHHDKRVDLLLNIWSSVHAKHTDARLLIVGSGVEEAYLRTKASEGVIFIGQVDDVAEYLKISDLFVLPSAREGLSNSILEAMAVGLPVAATAVGGTPDIVTHKKSGWLFQPNDSSALQNAMLKLLGDPELRSRLGRQARKHVLENYSIDAIADRVANLYRELLSL